MRFGFSFDFALGAAVYRFGYLAMRWHGHRDTSWAAMEKPWDFLANNVVKSTFYGYIHSP